jgi:large subunit ribosomal protein L17
MKHKVVGRKLGRNPSHRKAMLRNIVTSLLEHERIVTTVPKAKEVRRIAEKMITLGKRGDLHARRQALSYIRTKDIVAKLFDDLSPQYADRQGGYTRIIRTGTRYGDAAPMAIVELVGYEEAYEEPAEVDEEE